MAFLRNIRNSLFGVTSDPNSLGRDNETSAMLGAKLANSSKLTTSVNDLPGSPASLDEDVLAFKHFQYPNDLNTLANGHYIKFDVHENTTTGLSLTSDFHKSGFSNTIKGHEQLGVEYGAKFANLMGVVANSKAKEKIKHVDSDGIPLTDMALSESRYQASLTFTDTPETDPSINKIATTPENANNDNHSHTHNEISSVSILLYTPASTKFKTEANYENAETGLLGGLVGKDSITSKVLSGFSKVGGAAAMAALEVIVPGAGGFFNRRTGMAVNPNMEVAFKSVPFRSFNMEYKFAPKDKKELEQVHKIIQLFRFHMSPSLLGRTQYFASPSQFRLTYMYREKENNYIPKINKCVLENIEVDYSPGEKFTTLKQDETGASPQVITVQMQFKEMSIITKDTIADGF